MFDHARHEESQYSNEVVPEEGEINVDGGNNFMMPHPGWEDKVVTDVESETDKPVPDKESEGDGNFNYTKPRKASYS